MWLVIIFILTWIAWTIYAQQNLYRCKGMESILIGLLLTILTGLIIIIMGGLDVAGELL